MFKILYQNVKQGFHFKSTANSHFSDFITFLFAALQKEKKCNTLSSVSFVLDYRNRDTFVPRIFFVVIVHLCACQSWGARTGKVQARLKRWKANFRIVLTEIFSSQTSSLAGHDWRFYCQTQKTVNTWKISWTLIVYRPTAIKFRIRKQTSKPQTNYCCCLRFRYLTPYWLISRNTITFHKYFWCSRFSEFHSKSSRDNFTAPDMLIIP